MGLRGVLFKTDRDPFICPIQRGRGDCRSWSKEFRARLSEAAKEASVSGYQPELEERWTCFYFFKRLTPDLAESPDRVFAWFKDTIEAGG